MSNSLRLKTCVSNREPSDVAACLEIIDLMTQQLRQVSADVEGSVTEVCRGFSDMSTRAQAAIQSASQVVGTGESSGGADVLVRSVGQTMEDLLRNIRGTCEFSRDLRARIQELDSRVQAVEASLNQVEGISEKAKLVALNGQIEAARLGEAGLAFGVVACETKSLAANAASSSITIRRLVNDLGTSMRDASDRLQARTNADALMAEKSEATVRDMLQLLQSTHDQLTSSAQVTTNMSQQLSFDIARAVTAMQFQDRVSQRIEHVIEALQSIIDILRQHSKSADPKLVANIVKDWKRELELKYTMSSERELLSTSCQGQSDANSSSVELF